MKYKVIGWTDYDSIDLPEGEAGFGAENAILDEIKEKKFEFTGWEHQNLSCCVPVLNNGYKYLYSSRGWGSLMAEAHGFSGYYDYSNFSFGSFGDKGNLPKFPEIDYNLDDIKDIDSLAETYTINITEEESAKIKETKSISFSDFENFRYIDAHDKVIFKTPTEEYMLEVKLAEATLSLTDEERAFVHYNIGSSAAEEDRKKAEKLWQEAKKLVYLEFV